MIERYSLPKMRSIWQEEFKFKTMLDIELPKAETLILELYDRLGRKLEQRKLDSSTRFLETFDLSARAAGLYYLRMVTKDGFAVKEVIKQ